MQHCREPGRVHPGRDVPHHGCRRGYRDLPPDEEVREGPLRSEGEGGLLHAAVPAVRYREEHLPVALHRGQGRGDLEVLVFTAGLREIGLEGISTNGHKERKGQRETSAEKGPREVIAEKGPDPMTGEQRVEALGASPFARLLGMEILE